MWVIRGLYEYRTGIGVWEELCYLAGCIRFILVYVGVDWFDVTNGRSYVNKKAVQRAVELILRYTSDC